MTRLSIWNAFDLVLVAVMTLGTIVAFHTTPPSMLRTLLSLAFVTALPGYAFISVLFPGGIRPQVQSDAGPPSRRSPHLGGLETAALSIAMSIVIVALAGTLVSSSTFHPTIMLWGIGSLTYFLLLAALLRRLRLPANQRPQFNLDAVAGLASLRGSKLKTSVLLAIVVSTGIIVVSALTDKPVGFTELILEGGTRSSIATSSPIELRLSITNQELEATNYVLKIALVGPYNSVGDQDTADVATHEETVDIVELFLESGDSVRHQPQLMSPNQPGLFRIDATLLREADPEPYRRLHVWILVTDLSHDAEP